MKEREVVKMKGEREVERWRERTREERKVERKDMHAYGGFTNTCILFCPRRLAFFMLNEVDQWMLHTYIAKIQKLSLHSYHSALTCIA